MQTLVTLAIECKTVQTNTMLVHTCKFRDIVSAIALQNCTELVFTDVRLIYMKRLAFIKNLYQLPLVLFSPVYLSLFTEIALKMLLPHNQESEKQLIF